MPPMPADPTAKQRAIQAANVMVALTERLLDDTAAACRRAVAENPGPQTDGLVSEMLSHLQGFADDLTAICLAAVANPDNTDIQAGMKRATNMLLDAVVRIPPTTAIN